MSATLPVNLVVSDRRCVVLGSRAVADGKVQALASRGAAVTVVAEELTSEVESLASDGTVAWERRAYRPGDLEGAFFAVSGHEDQSVDEAVWREALERGVLVNTVDDAVRSVVVFPAIVRRGALQIAVSTEGRSPAVAVRVKQRLEAEFGDEYAVLLEILGDARPLVAGWRTQSDRAALWRSIVDSGVLDLVRAGHADQARQRVLRMIEAAKDTP